MKEDIDLESISDGRHYEIDDFVKADTEGCKGCYSCCHNVGDFVMLNPFDVYEITHYLNTTFDALLIDKVDMIFEDKIALPHLKMVGESNRCALLSKENRCLIHPARPNICRLFPLGRVYEQDDFKFFLQLGVCVKPNLKLIKVQQWIGIENYDANKTFLLTWHHLLKALHFRMKFIRTPEELKGINDYLLDTFYRTNETEHLDFYASFYAKLPEAKRTLGIL